LQQDGSKKLPGIGGVFNAVNLDVYHYAGQNPVKLVDPDGRADALNEGEESFMQRQNIQYKVMVDPEYQQGGSGHYKINNPKATWCNQATLDVIKENGMDLKMFTNEKGRAYTGATEMGKIMEKQAEKGNLKQVSGAEAQKLANKGYLVIAAAPGHVATVIGDYGKYDEKKGPKVAHVGAGKGREMYAKYSFKMNPNQIKYFYNPKQYLK
jgi:hypothetical protein